MSSNVLFISSYPVKNKSNSSNTKYYNYLNLVLIISYGKELRISYKHPGVLTII